MINLRHLQAILTATAFLTAEQAIADENRLFISQDSTAISGTLGNKIFVDQSAATASTISGTIGSETPARQTGGNNSANITISNVGGQVALNQTNTGGGNVNQADINLGGLFATGILTQVGIDNTGTLSVSGDGSSGTLLQEGDNNMGALYVIGSRSNGELIQRGNNNDTTFTVTGSNTSATMSLTGNNVISAGPTVTTNGGTVIINQIAAN